MTQPPPEELQELEPLEPASAGAPEAAPQGGGRPPYEAMILQRLMSGMPAPFFNVQADKAYYRFFFGGLLIALGCLMPFDADWSHVGYKTFIGALWLIVGLGVMWTMWGAIATGRVRFRWLMLAVFPLLWSIWHFFMNKNGLDFGPDASGWGEFFGLLGKNKLSEFGNALQHLGAGRILVFLGSLYVELQFVLGVVAGAKRGKQQQRERAAAARRR